MGQKAKAAKRLAKMNGKRLRMLAIAAGEELEIAAGGDPARAHLMAGDDVDPALREMWVRQLSGQPEPTPEPVPPGFVPLGMDQERYKLHTEAKLLAADRCAANPRLDPAKTYALAAVELADRDSGVVI